MEVLQDISVLQSQPPLDLHWWSLWEITSPVLVFFQCVTVQPQVRSKAKHGKKTHLKKTNPDTVSSPSPGKRRQPNPHVYIGQVLSLLTVLIHSAFLTLWRRSKWMVLTSGMQNFKISLISLFQHLEIFINYPSVHLVSTRSVLRVAHSFRSWQIIKNILINLIQWNNCGSYTTFSISVKTVPVAVDLGLYFIVLYSWFLISTWFFRYSSQHLWNSVLASFTRTSSALCWWNTWIWVLRLMSSYMSNESKNKMFLMWIIEQCKVVM